MKKLLFIISVLFTFSVSAAYEEATNIKLKDIKGNTYQQQTLDYLQSTSEMLGLQNRLPLNCDQQASKPCQIECDDFVENVSMALHGTDTFGQVYILAYLTSDRLITIKRTMNAIIIISYPSLS